ncbi:cupin domain-containing protein [Roseomonas sp. GC11]|uniref:cupin domain-containing protein n=1 Tax=Roseomonas sp. GC11 TaxID=2950546 RepID=UPI00210B8B14|nr:cupin domain-containing protein [Roseomonas sp. GC11]MCQ4161252.1 cupin domain-containing protein [Roseomonas sp. GC11]
MALLQTILPNPDAEPALSKPVAERLISGDPSFRTWLQDSSKDGRIRTGVWEATPGETLSIKGEGFEFCHILEGVIELVEEGQAPVRYKAGDSFVMKPGYRGVWRTLETVRKIYVAVS